jgi:hypothetical protein
MSKNIQKHNWLIDIAIMTGFLLSFFLNVTGLPLHQWLGVGVTVLMLVHLYLHWDWVTAVVKRIFSKTCARARLYLLLDVVIMLGVVVILETGLAISTWLNLEFYNFSSWVDIHIYSSLITLGLVVIKVGLHWRWIVTTAGKIFARKPGIRLKQSLRPVPVPVTVPALTRNVNRRQFLVLMGVVGTASVVAASNALSRVKAVQSAALESAGTPATSLTQAEPGLAQVQGGITSTATQGTVTLPNATATPVPQVAYVNPVQTTSCQVSCPRGCSYPGQCRRYIDTNQNRKCDLGECL